jgi:hypothetical protein
MEKSIEIYQLRQQEAIVNPANKIVVGWVLGIMAAAFLGGQATSARITGNVKDEDGAFLAGVTVTVTNIRNNAVTESITSKKGAFRLLTLEPGFYQVSFDLEGYESKVMSGIQLNADQSATLRIKLKKMIAPASTPE